jgi:hypothetical protein
MAILPEVFDATAIPPRVGYDTLPDIPAIARLKSRAQWVAWKYVDRGGPKPTKPPFQAETGMPASVNEPRHWANYHQAVMRAKRSRMEGVGYVLSADDGLTGIDLDNCRDPDTGELAAWAQEIVDLAETYCEVSPSETGLRLIVEGKISAAMKLDAAGVELYATGRYLTITGWHVHGTPTSINAAPLTLSTLEARIASMKPPKPEAPVHIRREPAPSTWSGDTSNPFRAVNDAALANLDAWVPDIFGSAARFQAGTGAYRIRSRDIGRDTQEDLSIAPNGIKDWGVHDMGDARDGSRTPIDIVQQFGREPHVRDAAMWLCSQLGRDPADFGFDRGSDVGAEITANLLRRVVVEDGTMTDAETGEVIEPSKGKSPGSILDRLSIGKNGDWTKPQGLLSDMADWILASSRRPNRPLAVASSLAVLSAVCGRHLYSPTSSTLNVYIVCLAGTAVGKNRPLSAVAEILRAAKLEKLQTTAKSFSVSSIEQMVMDHPCCVATVDEIGANLLGRMSHKNSNTHEMAMRGALLELWSREKGMAPFMTTRRAQSSSVEIPSPSISLFGVSTPEAFYASVTSGSVRDGFLNRFIIAPAAPRAKPIEVSDEARRVPNKLIGQILDILPISKGNLADALGIFAATVDIEGDRLEWAGKDVKKAAENFEEEILDLIDANPEQSPLMGRIYEYTVRLASLHAVSRAGRKARVELDDLEWGASWAIESARTMIDGALALMASNDYEQKFNAIRAAIEEAGQITQRELLRKVRTVMARERDAIIGHLKEGGWIEPVNFGTKTKPAVGWRWIG